MRFLSRIKTALKAIFWHKTTITLFIDGELKLPGLEERLYKRLDALVNEYFDLREGSK